MLTIFIDNKPYQVKPDQNLLQACLSLGFDLPYFCWHPAMHSVGACRQCAVKLFKDEKDTRGRIVMSCMTPVADGMRLSVDDPDAKAFRTSVTEWLMLNHPHDCPVCDEGGECHLQDITVMTGHAYRRTRFPKRTHRNQDLGPFINHEMNRCIQCYRCVRFYRGIAGGTDLNVFSCHDHVYFGRHEEGMLESGFSGNLVEICPTGVFTDKTLKAHYTRKWDLQTAPSLCVHCGVGCNTIAGERYGTLRRILNRYNNEVNGYFLCDRGRFGYEFVNSEKRIRTPLMRSPSPQRGEGRGEGKAVSKESALNNISEILSAGQKIIGIGSPRASLESNFALRALVGPDNFYSGMSEQEHKLVSLIIEILKSGPARTPSLHEVQTADAVLVLGEDVPNTAPLLALALRQSVRQRSFELAAKMKLPLWDDAAVRNIAQDRKSPLFIASHAVTRLDDIATKTLRAAPDDVARLGFAIAHELNPDVPAPPLPAGERNEARGDADIMPLVREIAAALKNAKRPLIVSGTGSMNEAVVRSAANVAWALSAAGKPAGLCYTAPECNSLGLGLMVGNSLGELLTSPSPPAGEGRGERVDALIILENDLYRRADAKIVDAFLARATSVIVIDHLLNETSSKADIALPAATFAEADGTLANNEGRAQRSYQVFAPRGDIQASWKWIHDIMKAAGRSAVFDRSWDALMNDIASSIPTFGPIADIAPNADFRIDGAKIPRQPHRYSGRTAMLANIDVHEPKPQDDPDSPLSFSMEGTETQPPSPLISRYWSPGWNSVQALNKFQQEVGGLLHGGDPGKRLIEPKQNATPVYFTDVPPASGLKPDDASLPRYSLFGSEELSSYSPAVIEAARLKRDKGSSS